MAILKIKKIIEDLENNTSQVLSSVTKLASTASNSGYATSAGNTGTSMFATSAGEAGTAQFAITAATGTSGSSL
jgi:hypothetical protein